MITHLSELQSALRGNKPLFAGIVLYEGPSLIDGAQIVVIANRIFNASGNSKTGDMVQTWIMRSDIKPTDAVKSGADSSVCGNCPHRPANAKPDANGKLKGGSCYVNIGRAPLGVWKAYRRGRYAVAGIDFDKALLPKLFAGKAFRMGSYGDPAAAPFPIWRLCTVNAAVINGYTHQWRDPRFQAFSRLCMASADSAADMHAAHDMDWRTFRVRGHEEPIFKGLEVVCPASKEAGYKTDCASCKSCGGNSAKAKVSMVIMAHGATANRFTVAA